MNILYGDEDVFIEFQNGSVTPLNVFVAREVLASSEDPYLFSYYELVFKDYVNKRQKKC